MIQPMEKDHAMTTNLLDATPDTGACSGGCDGACGQHATGNEIPPKFRDPETGALLPEKLLKSYLALEKRMARMVALPQADADADTRRGFYRALGVPETPDDYVITPKHPDLQADREVNARLHEAGFTPEQVQLVYDLACDHVMPQLDRLVGDLAATREREKLVTHFGGEARFREIARALDAWGRSNLPGPAFDALACTHQGVLALEAMMRNNEPGLRGTGHAGGEMLSEEQLVKLMRDPRYWKHRDPETLATVTEGFRRLYPG